MMNEIFFFNFDGEYVHAAMRIEKWNNMHACKTKHWEMVLIYCDPKSICVNYPYVQYFLELFI